jgi:hypothetical protein
MYYKHHRSKTAIYLVITIFILLLVVLWGQGLFG